MKRDNIFTVLLIVTIIIALIITHGRSCSNDSVDDIHIDTLMFSDTSIVFDTVPFYDTIPIELYVKIPVPEIIDSINDIKVYKDSSKNDDISIFWTDTVHGSLIGKSLSYTLNVPKEIIKTVTINNTETITKAVGKSYHKLYLDMVLGTQDKNIGITFIPKKDRFKFGYNYNISSNSHNVQIGVRLWQSKK